MGSSETARSNHDSAREEILERIRIRDSVLLAYVGAIAALFGVALGASTQVTLLLIVPYLALAGAIIVAQHDLTIGALSIYLSEELEPFLREAGEWAPAWESSAALRSYARTAINYRTIGHLIILILPAVVSLFLNLSAFAGSSPAIYTAWWIGVVAASGAAIVLAGNHKRRAHDYRRTNWQSHPSTAPPSDREPAATPETERSQTA